MIELGYSTILYFSTVKVRYIHRNISTIYTEMTMSKKLSYQIFYLFSFLPVSNNLTVFNFIIFSNGPNIPLTHSYSHFIIKSNSHFIIKLIYKNITHMAPTFSTHFLLHFLKLIPGQMVTNYDD